MTRRQWEQNRLRKTFHFFLNSHRDGKLMSSDKTKHIMFNYNYKYI